MEPDKEKEPKFWKRDHLTNLAVSYLIDDEIPSEIATPMRLHIKACRGCRKELLRQLRIDHKVNPKG